ISVNRVVRRRLRLVRNIRSGNPVQNPRFRKPGFAKCEGSMRFDLVDLGLFRHVVEAGSITRGAERAHLALAAASTRIRSMEQALGAPLLVRSRHGVTPT